MDKLSEHAIRMLEITDKPYRNEYGMINKDLQDKHDIAKAVYSIILQVQMLKEVNRKGNSSEKPNNSEIWHGDCKTCELYGTGCGIPCDYEPKTEPQTDEEQFCREHKCTFYRPQEGGCTKNTGDCPFTDEPQTERSDMSEIDKMIKMVDGILGDDGLCEGCEDVTEGLSCAECTRKYADKIIKILRDVKHKVQTERRE